MGGPAWEGPLAERAACADASARRPSQVTRSARQAGWTLALSRNRLFGSYCDFTATMRG